MALKAIDLAPCTGTEIQIGSKLLLSGKCAGEIRDVLERRGVVVIRRIGLDNQQKVAFAQALGDVLPQGDDHIMKVTLARNRHTSDCRLGSVG